MLKVQAMSACIIAKKECSICQPKNFTTVIKVIKAFLTFLLSATLN